MFAVRTPQGTSENEVPTEVPTKSITTGGCGGGGRRHSGTAAFAGGQAFSVGNIKVGIAPVACCSFCCFLCCSLRQRSNSSADVVAAAPLDPWASPAAAAVAAVGSAAGFAAASTGTGATFAAAELDPADPPTCAFRIGAAPADPENPPTGTGGGPFAGYERSNAAIGPSAGAVAATAAIGGGAASAGFAAAAASAASAVLCSQIILSIFWRKSSLPSTGCQIFGFLEGGSTPASSLAGAALRQTLSINFMILAIVSALYSSWPPPPPAAPCMATVVTTC